MDENPRADLEAYRAARELHADEQRMQEIKAAQKRYRRDTQIAWALMAITLAALSAYFLGVRPQPSAAFADECPGVTAQLNAYERELQQRECEARAHSRRVRELSSQCDVRNLRRLPPPKQTDASLYLRNIAAREAQPAIKPRLRIRLADQLFDT